MEAYDTLIRSIWRVAFYWMVLLCYVGKTSSVSGTLGAVASRSKGHECCFYKDDAQRLFSCIKNSSWISHQLADGASNVAIVTFTTEQTLSYASFAVATNAVYARRYGYAFRVFDAENTEVSGDPRWIKIQLLKEAMTQWARHYEYIVWLDSDLAIIDHSFRLEDVARSHPHADMIMSKDMATAPFVSNSGVIIVKNTQWSLNMLDLWWSSYDRDRCCDQNAFTWLYDRKLPADIQAKTALLPSNAINSDFPAWRNQQDNDRFLHLAGQSSIYRSIVFSAGFQHICSGEEGENSLASPVQQIGLTRDFLFRTMRTMNARRLESLTAMEQQVEQCSLSAASVVSHSSCVELANRIRRELEDTLKVDSDEANYFTAADYLLLARIRAKEVTLRMWIARVLLTRAQEYFQSPSNSVTADSALLLIIGSSDSVVEQSRVFGEVREAIGAVFEAHIASRSRGGGSAVGTMKVDNTDNTRGEGDGRAETLSSERMDADIEVNIDGNGAGDVSHSTQSLLQRCLSMIDAVLSSALPLTASVRGSFLYHRFKTLQFLAAGPLRDNTNSDLSVRINYLTSAVEDWQQMSQLDYFGGGGGGQYVLADPDKELTVVLSELALLHCLSGHHSAGVQVFLRSMQLQRRMVDGYSRIRIATDDNIAAALVTLADTTINAVTCVLRSDSPCDKAIISQTMLQHAHTLCKESQLVQNEPKKITILEDITHRLSVRCADPTRSKVLKKLKKVSRKVS